MGAHAKWNCYFWANGQNMSDKERHWEWEKKQYFLGEGYSVVFMPAVRQKESSKEMSFETLFFNYPFVLGVLVHDRPSDF